MEIGNSKENLILKTAGKLKVQWGKKFIDLLDNNGNLNVDTRKQENSMEELKELVEKQNTSIEELKETISELQKKISELEYDLEDQSEQIEDIYDKLDQNSQEPEESESESD